jgi:hypothetical protein
MAMDYSERDKAAKCTFYVLLYKRNGILQQLFDDYWRDIHGAVCARLPGQFQYWQLHVGHNVGGMFPAIQGVDMVTPPQSQFDGIAELTHKSVKDRNTWFTAAAVLMDDEHNIFSKAIGYVTDPGNSITYFDGIENGAPNCNQPPDLIKYHVMVRMKGGVSAADFRKFMTGTFAPAVMKSDKVLKLRLHLFEPPDLSRPDAAGVAHSEPVEENYHAAFEIAFANHLDQELFFASGEYANAVKNIAKYVKNIFPFPERYAATFVYDGKITLTGMRGSRGAELITSLGATNQLKEDILTLFGVK